MIPIMTKSESPSAARTERTVLAIDNSQIVSFLTCPRKWYFEYLRSIEPRSRDKWALDNGTIIHSMLDVYYRARAKGAKMNDALKMVYDVLQKNRAEGKLPNLNEREGKSGEDRYTFLVKRFAEYCTNYVSNDYVPLVINGIPQVELGFTIPLIDDPEYLIVLEGRIDLITTQEMFVDHKTQERLSNYYSYDTQFLTYATALDIRLGGINYVGLQQVLTEKSFRRNTINFSTSQIERWRDKLANIAYDMKTFLEMSSQFSSYEDWEYNPISCSGPFKTNPCIYHRICEQPNHQVGNIIIEREYNPKPIWEPWSLASLDSPLER